MRFNEMLISALLLCNHLPQNIMPSTTASFLVIRCKSLSLARLLFRARICVCRFRFSFLLYPLSSFRVCSFLSSRFGFRSVEYFSVRIYKFSLRCFILSFSLSLLTLKLFIKIPGIHLSKNGNWFG